MENQSIRKPVVAGQFYPGTESELQSLLENFFSNSKDKNIEGIRAIIAPHAGYVFSGEVASNSYKQLDSNNKYENVFVIVSSHTLHFQGASIYSIGNYLTPLGEVKVNDDLANKLIEENDIFSFVKEAHKTEHSLEVQLPFLQFLYKDDLQIIPIVIGTQNEEDIKKIAAALKPYFIQENLFVISSDFSHYPKYDDANRLDLELAESILLNSSADFIAMVNNHKNGNISNLVTRACGWSSILTLLYLTEGNPDFKYHHIMYKNSGDADFGDKSRVVGYNAIVLSEKKEEKFSLNEEDQKILLEIARSSMEHYIESGNKLKINPETLHESVKEKYGAFVTLKKEHKLRGCIGNFAAELPLWETVLEMGVASSTRDTRFDPVKEDEFDDITIEISVLSPLKKIKSIDEIEMGKHGIYIKKGYYSGTFLPQVATETGWTLEEFLGHCAKDKAGIGWEGWKGAEIFTYEAFVFEE